MAFVVRAIGPNDAGSPSMSRRQWIVASAGAVMGVVAMAAASWACVSGALVTLSASQAKAGQEVGIKGLGFPKTDTCLLYTSDAADE